jgi:hypothetical protein
VVRSRSVLVVALVLAPLTTLAQNDLMTVSRVVLTVDGNEFATFNGFVEIVAEARSLEFFDGTLDGRGRVTLSRPASSNLDFWAWHEHRGRKSVDVLVYNPRGTLILRYRLARAWPARVEIRGPEAGGVDVPIETVTLVAESIERIRL